MKRSNLQTIYFKKRTPESLKKNIRSKKTTVVIYIKMNAGRFLATRIQAIFVTRKTVGKYIQPFFSEKRKISNKIISVDDDDAIVSDDQSISEKQTKQLF